MLLKCLNMIPRVIPLSLQLIVLLVFCVSWSNGNIAVRNMSITMTNAEAIAWSPSPPPPEEFSCRYLEVSDTCISIHHDGEARDLYLVVLGVFLFLFFYEITKLHYLVFTTTRPRVFALVYLIFYIVSFFDSLLLLPHQLPYFAIRTSMFSLVTMGHVFLLEGKHCYRSTIHAMAICMYFL